MDHIPVFSEQEAASIARQLYGVEGKVRALPGELDYNFHIFIPAANDTLASSLRLRQSDRKYMRSAAGQEYVLKIAHAQESRAILDLQNQTLRYLEAQDLAIAFPRVCSTTSGELIATHTASNGTSYLVRLFTYVPGQLLAQANPHSPDLLYSLGAMLGTLDQALLNFKHPAAQRMLKWDIVQAGWVRDYLQHIAQPERRAMAERLFAAFEEQVVPVLPELRTSIIYNDANDYNVVVSDVPANYTESRRVLGFIDFGDMVQTATVCDLAIAATYAMLGKVDPLSAAAQVVAGYHSTLPLSETELAVLYPLICTRLCASVVNSAYQQIAHPENSYLQISEQPAWELIERLMSVPPQLAHYTFRHACDLPACPNSAQVVEWLTQQRGQIASLVEPVSTVENTMVFDLSIGSPELGNVPDFADSGERGAFTKTLFERMHAQNAIIGVGKYNEARPIYTAEMFKFEGENGPERRSIHAALDIFMEVGTPIFAPLDGVVQSAVNNTGSQDYGPTIVLRHTIPDGPTFYTLYGHLTTDSLDGMKPGMSVARGSVVARIGDLHENGGWPPHLHFQLICDLLGRDGEFPGVVSATQREIWLSICPDPNVIAGIPAACFGSTPKGQGDRKGSPYTGTRTAALDAEQILALRKKHIGKNLSISYNKPLHMVRGYRQFLYDESGRPYLDGVNNVSHVGHSHPHVIQAGQRQMAVLNTNSRYLHAGLVRYAERLSATLPEPLSVCFFVCSGSEANELALRLARAHTRRKDVIVVDHAYHGNTSTLIDVSPYKFDGPGGRGAPSYVHKVPLPDTYRGFYKQDVPLVGERYAQFVAAAIERMAQRDKQPGAFIAESVGGVSGQVVFPEGYLKAAYDHVRAAGGVCIADEVQTGFGRVGSHFWAFETQGVVPDIVTMGKPIGNGHPLGAVVTTPEIAASFNNGMEYFNTFGGNPVSTAIGQAVLDVIENEGLQENALSTGNHLQAGLHELMGRYPLIGDVRGLGLFVGAELVLDRETLVPAADQASYVVNRLRDHGILFSTDGPLHNIIKTKPPLVFNRDDADRVVQTLDKILKEDFVQV